MSYSSVALSTAVRPSLAARMRNGLRLHIGVEGHVLTLDSGNLTKQKYEYGSNVANDSRTLAMLCGVFLLMTAVWPLWRVRNLDVLVLAGLTLSAVFYNRGMLLRMALVSYPGLTYIATRCAWWVWEGAARRNHRFRSSTISPATGAARSRPGCFVSSGSRRRSPWRWWD